MARSIVFPSDPFSMSKVDEEFNHEYNLVKELGGHVVLVDHNELSSNNFRSRGTLSSKQASEIEHFIGTTEQRQELIDSLSENVAYDVNAFYRGWMMNSDMYQFMRWQLGTRLIELVTNTADYRAALYFGNWYYHFSSVTPTSTYFPTDFSWNTAKKIIAYNIPEGRYIVKDHVKSRKHEWDTACFAPDFNSLESVINEFKRLQGEFIEVGIVVREYEDFRSDLGEARLWWVDGKLAMISPHPDTPDTLPEVDYSEVEPLVQSFNRPFITTDMALREDGTWRVVEVSDGQVSGTPKGYDMTPLFQTLIYGDES